MASASVQIAGSARTGQLLLACVTEHGSAAHSYATSQKLLSGPDASRNLADLIHFLSTLHGLHPGVVDHAAARVVDPDARDWIEDAATAFAAERFYLTRLAVAAGPVPSTPGAADSDNAVRGQAHALEMLAQSERNGCALGAAIAVALDWQYVRSALDAAAIRFGVEVQPYDAAQPERLRRLADSFADSPSTQRALLFGAQQILIQHYGLWDLLEARQQAREG
ncbi:DUF6975 family protein [Sphingosinicella rhizophila]|uniref:Heme oxygenase n=1 Tax=Sphingosinicella rhizophila TaxID=3050082 RepID=A0ABU3Q2L1_9SPHN|nr:hypothetical protein [Sphingosinicella sp. GR2756]MDT9597614.1 hypothetical protein [Sphingosinicella sp. GR2756]